MFMHWYHKVWCCFVQFNHITTPPHTHTKKTLFVFSEISSILLHHAMPNLLWNWKLTGQQCFSASPNPCTRCTKPSLTWLQRRRKKALQYILRCIWTWLNPFSTDRHFCREKDECAEECRLRPGAKVCIPQHYSTFITAAGCTGSCLAGWARSSCQSVGNNWLRLPSEKSTSSAATLLLKTSETPAPLLSGEEKEKERTNLWYWNWHGAASWMPPYIFIYPTGMGFHWKDDDCETIKSLSAYCHHEIRVQRDSVHCGSNFSGGGIIKTVPSLDFPNGGVALIPNCFSIKLKVLQHASKK